MSHLLSVSNLEVSFISKSGSLKAVDGVSYDISKGETLGIVGESGCGKSVTSFALMGLLERNGKITGGSVIFDGVDLNKLNDEEMRLLRGKRVAMIFQEPMTALNPVLTIGVQIAEQMLAHENIFRHAAMNRTIELLKLVGIPSPEKRVESYPHQMSGGMRQRAMIAMALSCNPDLLIADEPTTALDVTIQAQILDLLKDLQKRTGMAMQFITHDLNVIAEVADRVLVMYAGRVVEEGKPAEIFADPRHPYTVGLLRSMPRLEDAREKLATIEGNVPPLNQMPSGCRFRDRCSRAVEKCVSEIPPLEEFAPGRRAACFNP